MIVTINTDEMDIVTSSYINAGMRGSSIIIASLPIIFNMSFFSISLFPIGAFRKPFTLRFLSLPDLLYR